MLQCIPINPSHPPIQLFPPYLVTLTKLYTIRGRLNAGSAKNSNVHSKSRSLHRSYTFCSFHQSHRTTFNDSGIRFFFPFLHPTPTCKKKNQFDIDKSTEISVEKKKILIASNLLSITL